MPHPYPSNPSIPNTPLGVVFIVISPAQALLLFSRSLDTNTDCSRLVADGWLEMAVPDADAALRLLAAAMRLRSSWDRLLRQLLAAPRGEETEQRPNPRDVSALTRGLLEFIHTEVIEVSSRLTAEKHRDAAV